MAKPTDQGTRWESTLRTRAMMLGRSAQRNAKRGQAHESDVTVTGTEMLPVVAWKNYLKGGARRKAVRMVVMLEDDFWKLVALDTRARYGYEIQAKATQNLGVRATLEGIVAWTKARM